MKKSKANSEPQILLDCDIIRHFYGGEKLHFLAKIFPKRFVILDKVRDELYRSRSIKQQIEFFITTTKIEIITFPSDRETTIEYAKLKSKYGDGESACMAVAKVHKKYIASSNLRDIKRYCIENQIQYFTTMDLLMQAIVKNIFTEAECDIFIALVKAKGSKLPCNTIAEFRKIQKEK